MSKIIEKAIGSYIASFQAEKYIVIGASPVGIINELQKCSKQITIIDIRSEKLEKVKKFISNEVNLRLVEEGYEFSNFLDNTFDCAVFYDVLHHFSNKKRIISETKRILQNNSYAFFAEPNISSKWLREYDQFGELKNSIYKKKFISILKENFFEIKSHTDAVTSIMQISFRV